MAKSKFTKDQILSILQQANNGQSITDVCCDHRISGTTFFQWRKKFAPTPLATLVPTLADSPAPAEAQTLATGKTKKHGTPTSAAP